MLLIRAINYIKKKTLLNTSNHCRIFIFERLFLEEFFPSTPTPPLNTHAHTVGFKVYVFIVHHAPLLKIKSPVWRDVTIFYDCFYSEKKILYKVACQDPVKMKYGSPLALYFTVFNYKSAWSDEYFYYNKLRIARS